MLLVPYMWASMTFLPKFSMKKSTCSESHACSDGNLGEFLLHEVVFLGRNGNFPLDFF